MTCVQLNDNHREKQPEQLSTRNCKNRIFTASDYGAQSQL